MWRNWSMKTWNNLVKYLFFQAHFLMVASALETIFFIYELPYIWPIIAWVWFNIGVDVEVFPLIILLVLYVPDPTLGIGFSLFFPNIFFSGGASNFVGYNPILRNIFLIASTNRTALGLTEFVLKKKWTFRD